MDILQALTKVTESIKAWTTNKLQNKVDKINGKILSSNDYTDEDAERVSAIGDISALNTFEKETLVGAINEIKNNGNKNQPVTNYLNSGSKGKIMPMVSFMDDDCRKQTYDVLFEKVIKEANIPYTIACPPGSIDDEGGTYMTSDNLKKMYDYGVSVSCHHWRQYNMDDTELLPTSDVYDEDLQKCTNKFKEWGIDVKSVCYPQGKYKSDYINVAKKYYHMGFTVDRGINQVPYESFFMKRNEVFPTNGAYTLEDAKALVNDLAASGGWLIFMTHAWYNTFNVDDLLDLITYIQGMKIDIVDVNEAIKRTGNVIDLGNFKKPVEEITDPYFVVDATGRAWTNSLTLKKAPTIKYNILPTDYHTSTYINPSGAVKDHTDINRTLSLPIEVKAGEVYLLTCSAIYEQALYVIGAPIEGSRSITAFENCYIKPRTNTDEAIVGDTILIDYEVIIPQDGIMYVSSNRKIQPNGFVVKKVETVEDNIGSALDGYVTNEYMDSVVGGLENLKTTNKDSIVGAINELYIMIQSLANSNTSTEIVKLDSFVNGIDEKKVIDDTYIAGTNATTPGKLLGQNGSYKGVRICSTQWNVNPGEVYKLTCSAIYEAACFCVYDSSGNALTNYTYNSDNTSTGTSLIDYEVVMPSNASYFRVAANLSIDGVKGFVIKQVVTS